MDVQIFGWGFGGKATKNEPGDLVASKDGPIDVIFVDGKFIQKTSQ